MESKEFKKLIEIFNFDISLDDLVVVEVVCFEFFDGLEIFVIYYKLFSVLVDNFVFVLVWVYGGLGG